MDISVSLLGFDRAIRAFHAAPELTRREMLAWGETTGAHLTDEVTSITPKDSGLLQGSIKPFVERVGQFGISVTVGTPLNYALPVEFGSKPHDITPKNGKALRFMMHGMPVFAKKIHHPGTKGAFMFNQAFDANISQILDSYSHMLDGLLAKIAAGAR
jgi:hypothetical protein